MADCESRAHPFTLVDLAGYGLRDQLRMARELDGIGIDGVVLDGGSLVVPDPILLAAAASRTAPSIGLIVRLSPWQQSPFHTARALGTLDALTGGRAGWLISEEPPNFVSTDDTERWNPAHVGGAEEFADAAVEYVDAALALWNSWEEGAILADVDSGQYIDPTKVHVTRFHGRYYSVRGPLNMPRSPQGRPVILSRCHDDSISRVESDVIIVSSEESVRPARRSGAAIVVREIGGSIALGPVETSADGLLVSGLSPSEYGRLLTGERPPGSSHQAVRPPRTHDRLLRDRLGIDAERFEWKAYLGSVSA